MATLLLAVNSLAKKKEDKTPQPCSLSPLPLLPRERERGRQFDPPSESIEGFLGSASAASRRVFPRRPVAFLGRRFSRTKARTGAPYQFLSSPACSPSVFGKSCAQIVSFS
jgi:hypothetical protein